MISWKQIGIEMRGKNYGPMQNRLNWFVDNNLSGCVAAYKNCKTTEQAKALSDMLAKAQSCTDACKLCKPKHKNNK